jgi:hypothetical protein
MAEFLTTDGDGSVGNAFGLAKIDGGVLPVILAPAPPGTGTVTTVTATGPVTITGVPTVTPNVTLTSPSRVYANATPLVPLTGSFTIFAQATLTPSNTGKLQISVQAVVFNNSEVTGDYQVQIDDGTHTLYSSNAIITPTAAENIFAITIDSDLPTGSGTPETYPLGVPVTIFMRLRESPTIAGFLQATSGGLLVKENVV